MTGRIVPTMKYVDAHAAIKWLCAAFEFEEHMVVATPDNLIAHAQLKFEGGIIMLSSAANGEFDALQKPPKLVGGIGTQSAYIVVSDVDKHYKTSVDNGAEIVMPIRDEAHGGRGYSCKDPEGHLWNFGSYDPWARAEPR